MATCPPAPSPGRPLSRHFGQRGCCLSDSAGDRSKALGRGVDLVSSALLGRGHSADTSGVSLRSAASGLCLLPGCPVQTGSRWRVGAGLPAPSAPPERGCVAWDRPGAGRPVLPSERVKSRRTVSGVGHPCELTARVWLSEPFWFPSAVILEFWHFTVFLQLPVYTCGVWIFIVVIIILVVYLNAD